MLRPHALPALALAAALSTASPYLEAHPASPIRLGQASSINSHAGPTHASNGTDTAATRAGVPATATTTRIAVPVASIFHDPNPSSERVTQALLGEAVRVIETRGAWSHVYVTGQYRLAEGYPGWVLSSALGSAPSPQGAEVTVGAARCSIRQQPDAQAAAVSGAFLATRLRVKSTATPGWVEVQVPGTERTGWVCCSDLVAEGKAAAIAERSGASVIRTALLLRGTPYLWGGLSALGIDCSGLTSIAYRLHGIVLPRDADQQALVGEVVERKALQAGDLLFFGKTPRAITHVGMYWEDGKMVEASSHGGVKVSLLAARNAIYQGARRVLGVRVVMPPPSP